MNFHCNSPRFMLTSDVVSKKDPGLKPKPYLPSVNIILFHISFECATRQTHEQIDSKSNRAIPLCPYRSLLHHPSHLEDLSQTNSSRLCPAWIYNQAFLSCRKNTSYRDISRSSFEAGRPVMHRLKCATWADFARTEAAEDIALS